MDEFKHLKIPFEEIKRATCNFSDKVIIGSGGFGKVYEGEVSRSKGRSIVAIKRLDRKYGQGEPEFWKEIMMLSRYTHTNIVSLLGFCDEDGEKILVYEHASNGSLDRHLSSGSLTWAQRIKICLDAAKGLTYLHDHKGTQQRVLHRDIKSANILLDQNWNAKLSDMGLSKLGPANQLHTRIITNVVGTVGYCDPEYIMTYTLAKESDVYSFGVVLFEVLCGRLCFELDSNRELRVLVSMWKESYISQKIDKIIFKDLKTPMDKTSLKIFVDIAFQCVHELREQRPNMSLVVEKLHIALKFQKHYESKLMIKDYDKGELIKAAKALSDYKHLENLTFKGISVLLNSDKSKREVVKQKDVEGKDGGTTKARKGTAQPKGSRGGGRWQWLVAVVMAPMMVVALVVAMAVGVVWMVVMAVVVAVAVAGDNSGDGRGWRRRWRLRWWRAVMGLVGVVMVSVVGHNIGWWDRWWRQRSREMVVGLVLMVGVVVVIVVVNAVVDVVVAMTGGANGR